MPTESVIKKSALAPTVLIAGGAGFIGSHLAETMLLKDARVIVLDNFRVGKDVYVNSLLQNPKFALFDVDINQGLPKNIESVDYIFHLAGVESYLYSQDNVNLDSLLTNALGTKNLLDLANKSQAKFLLASSISVYQGLISPINLEHYFGQTQEEEKKYSLSEAKRFAEALVWEYFKKNQTNVRIARLPEVYGPRMNLNSSGSLGILLKELMENKNLTVIGDGTEKEYYLYISDAISGLIKALFAEKTEGKIYSFVQKEPHAVLETTYLIKSLADREIQIDFKPKSQNILPPEPKISERGTVREIKWDAKVELKEGVTKTLAWFGYEVNSHSFKLNKLVDNKAKDKAIKKLGGGISSIGIEEIQQVKDINTQPKVRFSLKEFLQKLKLNMPKRSVLQKTITPHHNRITYLIAFLFSLLALVLIFAGIPAFQTYVHLNKAVNDLQKYPQALTQLDTNKSKDLANESFQEFIKAKKSFNKLRWVFFMAGKEEMHTSGVNALTSGAYLSKAVYHTSKASAPFTTLSEVLKPTTDLKIDKSKFENTKSDFENAKNNLQLAQLHLNGVDTKIFPKSISNKIRGYDSVLSDFAEGLDIGELLASQIPEIMGSNETKRYLILFQNSNEIRATGGFIGSYGILELNKGKIMSLAIDDIYNPDGQIDSRGIFISAPKQIQDFLKEEKLYIRNANWSPDFPESASTIVSLFNKLGSDRIDGVIALDLHFATNLIKITGPVFLIAYNEEINSNNLYERAQFHSDFNFEAGSDQKRSFLTILGGKLLEKLFALPKEKMPSLVTEITRMLNQKHLSLYFFNNPLNAELEKKGWNGNLVKTDKDYLYVVNSNLGGTKANYYVKNSMEYKVTSDTRDGLLRGELTLTYKHTGKDNAWPGGPYKDYVRVLTQTGTRLTKAGIVKANGTKEDVFKSVAITKVKNYNSFETSFVLNPGETIKVIIGYDLPKSLSINPAGKSYSLYWQKQPGTQDDDYKLLFSAPFGMKIQSAKPIVKYSGTLIEYSGKLNTDNTFEFKIN